MVCQLKLVGVLVGVVGLAVGQAYGEGGQGHGSMTQPTTQPTTQPGAEGAMGEMMQQMMANMAAYGEAGPEHEFLKRRVGNWEHTATMWHAPGSEPMVTTGKTQTELIMGGRFLLDRSTGEFHGQTFEGLGIGGYDRIKKKYVGIWLDNMSTGVFVAEGEKASDADVVNYASTYSCVMTGTVKHGKSVETIIDDDTWKLEMYDINEDGTEWKAFELLYKRVE